MATLYLKAAGGNWTAAATWSTTGSAGVDSAGPPTAADDAVAELGSGNVTVDTGAVCRSFDTTSGTGSWGGTLTTTASLGIGDGTAGAGNVALKLNSGVTLTLGPGNFNFISTSATVQTIDFAGKTTASLNFSGAGGSYQFTGAHTCGATASVTLTRGTLDTNGQTCSWGLFSSNNSNTRVLTLGASAITITGTGTPWNTATATGLTITANTATVTCSGSSITFSGGSANTMPSVVLSGANPTVSATNFANLTKTGTAVKTDTLVLSGSINVTDTFTCNGNSATNRVLVQSSTVGTARTITAATVTVTNSDFMDITGAGAGSWDLSAITGLSGDCGGNSGITFTTAATQTWDGTSGGNWSANAWSGRVPLPQDDVVINAAFGASQTVTMDMPRSGKSTDFTGVSGSPTLAVGVNTDIFGSFILSSDLAATVTGIFTITFRGRGTHTIDYAGKSSLQVNSINAVSGTYSLSSALSTNNNLNINSGSFVSNSFSITCLTFNTTGSVTRSVTLGTSTITVTSGAAATVINLVSTGLTFSGASATFVISVASANTRIVAGGNQSIGTLTYTVAGSTGALTINNGNTFGTINFSDITNARTLTLPAGATTTILTAFNVNGTSGKNMTVTSGTGHTLSKSSGIVSCDYLILLNSNATGGATWYAGANSTDNGGNTGWIFTGVPYTETGAQWSIQAIANHYAGTTGLSVQEALCKYYGYTGLPYTEQQIFCIRRGVTPSNRDSVQESLYKNLKTLLSLTGTPTDYSEQDLWNKAFKSSLTLVQIVGS